MDIDHIVQEKLLHNSQRTVELGGRILIMRELHCRQTKNNFVPHISWLFQEHWTTIQSQVLFRLWLVVMRVENNVQWYINNQAHTGVAPEIH